MACSEVGVVGLCSMYEATGDEKYLEIAKKEVDQAIAAGELSGANSGGASDSPDGSVWCGVPGAADAARSLFVLFEKTGDGKYKDAISAVMGRVRAYLNDEQDLDLDDAARILPFYMEYETKFDKKECYNDVIARFARAVETHYDEKSGLLQGDGDKTNACAGKAADAGFRTATNVSSSCAANVPCGDSGEPKSAAALQLEREGWLMTALVDAIEQTSVEIYEHYRKLCDLYKQLLHGLMPYLDAASGKFAIDGCADKGANARIAYSMLKACRMGVVLTEKYIDVAARDAKVVLADAGVAAAAEDGNCDAAGMLKGEYIKYTKTCAA